MQKFFTKLNSPVDGRTSLIDRPIDRPASTYKAESKNSWPGRWQNKADRPTYQPARIDRQSREQKFSARSMGQQGDRLREVLCFETF